MGTVTILRTNYPRLFREFRRPVGFFSRIGGRRFGQPERGSAACVGGPSDRQSLFRAQADAREAHPEFFGDEGGARVANPAGSHAAILSPS